MKDKNGKPTAPATSKEPAKKLLLKKEMLRRLTRSELEHAMGGDGTNTESIRTHLSNSH
jgi:hypothetical protein